MFEERDFELWCYFYLFIAAGHPSPFGPFSLLQAPWLDPAYLNLTNFGQFGTNLGSLAALPCPPSWEHHVRTMGLMKGNALFQ